jgi:hypothetical protein
MTLLLCLAAAPIGYAAGVLLADLLWWLTH